jgi:hypothetical protein
MAFAIRNSVNIDKTNVGSAERIRGNRIQNPDEMTCPMWNGMDLAGRPACANSFDTKMEGCNSPQDRILVENDLRPAYSVFIPILDAAGIKGNFSRSKLVRSNDIAAASAAKTASAAMAIKSGTPGFGLVSGADAISSAGSSGSDDVRAANAMVVSPYSPYGDPAYAENSRKEQALRVGTKASLLGDNDTPWGVAADFTANVGNFGPRYGPLKDVMPTTPRWLSGGYKDRQDWVSAQQSAAASEQANTKAMVASQTLAQASQTHAQAVAVAQRTQQMAATAATAAARAQQQVAQAPPAAKPQAMKVAQAAKMQATQAATAAQAAAKTANDAAQAKAMAAQMSAVAQAKVAKR